jgi:hypothetical protein
MDRYIIVALNVILILGIYFLVNNDRLDKKKKTGQYLTLDFDLAGVVGVLSGFAGANVDDASAAEEKKISSTMV